jgi:tetratricopeptide (TPR) repeat protein
MRGIGVAIVCALVTSGCATAISGSADSVARLERARAADPQSEAVERSLGIAYFKANRLADARSALQKAVAMDNHDGVAALYLGLTAEAQNDLPGARAAYESYLTVGKTRKAKNQIRDRLAALKLKEVQVAAQAALAREAQLASVPGPPNTVAVMPFSFVGSDTSLKPLERGFAELLTTDLSHVSRLTVVERMRLQALLDEMTLQQSAGAAAGTGVRAGKVLQVSKMIGGSIQQQGNQLQTSAIVTDVSTTDVGSPARDTRSIDQLFTMEKNIVLELLQSMNIVPTTAERNAIEQRPTQSLAAFLAYSRGLELEDRGQFDEAGRLFDNAVRLDPNFGSARQRSSEAKAAATGTQVTASTVESSLRGTAEGQAVAAATSGSVNTNLVGGAAALAEGLNPSIAGAATLGGAGIVNTELVKDVSTGTGGDNPTTHTGTVTIILRQPGAP